MLLITAIVARRARADERARRFFDLSHDMLCTLDVDGRCRRGQRRLGPPPRLHAGGAARRAACSTSPTPTTSERALAEAIEPVQGGASSVLETRVRAKDGSWHWLRSSSTLAPDERLVYARSTDITELKRIEAEREKLLGEVEDAGPPRRPHRAAQPAGAATNSCRARWPGRAAAESPLCLAIVDIDHFKAYNDTHGHLAGDEVLRACAIAWDSALRGEDTLVRFGGEEFLVLLPDTAPEQAAEIVERLRAATPLEQTCSAGLALWDYAESIDDLLRPRRRGALPGQGRRPRPARRRPADRLGACRVMMRAWVARARTRGALPHAPAATRS